jgi:hypothetical protein
VSNPYGNDPYGQQPPPPPSSPYGPPGGSSGFNEQPKTDGVSIAAFVLSLLCCSPVALVLGIVGIVRTKGGQRKGRWAAITGLILSIIGLIAGAVVIAIGGVFLASVVEPGEAEVGQCVNIDEDGNEVLMREAECDEEHDAEIVGVVEVTDENLEQIEAEMVGYCFTTVISEEDLAKIQEVTNPLEDIKAITQDPNDVEVDDDLVCYVEPGDKLDEPIL